MSEPLEQPELLFDFEPAESSAEASVGQVSNIPAKSTEPEEKTDDVETQGALDIGIAIPTPFSEPEVDEEIEAEAEEVNEDVLKHPESAPRKHPNKVSFYQEPEDTARLRGAVLHTMVAEGHRSLSQFVIRAVMKEVQRLEEKYNDGKPFPAVAANEMPQGRPQR
ncbi:MAG TPA: hypothetical protein VIG67_06655 [Yaniella sp.]